MPRARKADPNPIGDDQGSGSDSEAPKVDELEQQVEDEGDEGDSEEDDSVAVPVPQVLHTFVSPRFYTFQFKYASNLTLFSTQKADCMHPVDSTFQKCQCDCDESCPDYIARCKTGVPCCPTCKGPPKKVVSNFWWPSDIQDEFDDGEHPADWIEYCLPSDQIAKNLAGLERRFPAHEFEPEDSCLDELELATFWDGCHTPGFATKQ
jgi:hypothetical protein